MIPQNRLNNPTTIDRDLIDTEIKNGKDVIVQFSDKTYNDNILQDLNDLCLEYDHNFSVRFYGHYSNSFDCKIVENIPNVKSLYIDCIVKAENIEVLTKLYQLQKLSVGIIELKNVEFFSAENFKELEELAIYQTRIKSVNLEYLRDYKKLKSLFIQGHTKNIDAIAELSNLESLSLNSISKVPVGFVNNLKKLKTLRFILGGRENINEIEENSIELLEIAWVRGYNDLSKIGNFRNLKTLLIENQIRLPIIHFDKQLINFSDLRIVNCKTLSKLTGLENLPSLNQLRIFKTSIDFDKFILQPRPSALKILAFYTCKSKIDKGIGERLSSLGYSDGLERKSN